MVSISTQLKKLKSKFPRSGSITSISAENQSEGEIKSRGSTKTNCKQPLNQQIIDKTLIQNSTTNTQNDCPTMDLPSQSYIATADENTFSFEHNYKTPIIEYPQRDKKKVSQVLKKALLPHKTYYELEWAIPNYDNATTSKVWLQIDDQTSKGIERVRRLGYNNLDVRLDDKLTEYMINSVDKKENILIEILFSSGNYHDYRKDSVLQPSASDQRKIHLVRLRRVHWWVKDYNLARAHLP